MRMSIRILKSLLIIIVLVFDEIINIIQILDRIFL